MKYTALIDGERVDIEVIHSETAVTEAQVGGRKYSLDAKAVEPGIYWFNWNNRSIEISVTPNGDAYTVSAGGRRTLVEIVDARTALRKAAQQGHAGTVELRAPMPGKVVEVLVNEGAQVEMNQGILVIEAMKMQNEIKSPKRGTVKKILASEGAPVNAGDLLAVVE